MGSTLKVPFETLRLDEYPRYCIGCRVIFFRMSPVFFDVKSQLKPNSVDHVLTGAGFVSVKPVRPRIAMISFLSPLIFKLLLLVHCKFRSRGKSGNRIIILSTISRSVIHDMASDTFRPACSLANPRQEPVIIGVFGKPE